jgi:hypothetical protein
MELFIDVFEGYVRFYCGDRSGGEPRTLLEALPIIIGIFPVGMVESIRISYKGGVDFAA